MTSEQRTIDQYASLSIAFFQPKLVVAMVGCSKSHIFGRNPNRQTPHLRTQNLCVPDSLARLSPHLRTSSSLARLNFDPLALLTFRICCQYWCMSDTNLICAPQQNVLTCAPHWNLGPLWGFISQILQGNIYIILYNNIHCHLGGQVRGGVRGRRDLSPLTATLGFFGFSC